jgi:glucosamine 6-phosphate synthetase-like amidotransferase/phosphosugar isomerase protein
MMGLPRTLAALPIVAVLACGGTKVMVPPRIDLQQHEVLAIIEFTSSNEGKLGELATTRFMEEVRIDQGLVRIVELGSEEEALRQVGSDRLDRAAYLALGQEHNVATIFTGELEISDIRPAVSISGDLRNFGAAADVDATLTVQMIETASGASLWSRSASVTQRVGQVSLIGGRPVFDADDPEHAYGELVHVLVDLVTADFKVSWVKQ